MMSFHQRLCFLVVLLPLSIVLHSSCASPLGSSKAANLSTKSSRSVVVEKRIGQLQAKANDLEARIKKTSNDLEARIKNLEAKASKMASQRQERVPSNIVSKTAASKELEWALGFLALMIMMCCWGQISRNDMLIIALGGITGGVLQILAKQYLKDHPELLEDKAREPT